MGKRAKRSEQYMAVFYASILAMAVFIGIVAPAPAQQQSDAGLADVCGNQPPPDGDCEDADDASTVSPGGGTVHLSRGTFSEKYSVYELPSPSIRSHLALHYKNRYNVSCSFGWGWNSLLDCRIYEYPIGTAVTAYALVVGPQGQNWAYYKDAAGNFEHPEGYFAELSRNGDGSYDWQRPDGTTWRYDSGGRLQSIRDRNSNTVSLHYAAIGISQAEGRRDYFDDFENNPHLNWIRSEVLPGADPRGCRWGDSKYSQVGVEITSDPLEVISGNYSVKATLLPTAGPYWYNDILVSSFNMFKPLTRYRVSFKYKCLAPIGNGFIRTGFWNQNDMYNYGTMDEAVEFSPAAGEQGVKSITYTTKDLQHYCFMIQLVRRGSPNTGTIVFDDIQVEEISSNPPAAKEAVVRITDAQGRDTHINYGPNGLVSQVVDPAGRSTEFFYDAHNDLIRIAGPGGRVAEYLYDDTHNLVQITDPAGHTETVEYFRGSDRVIGVRSADGAVHRFERDFGATLLDLRTAYIDPVGNCREATFGFFGYLTYAEVVTGEVLADGSRRVREWSLDRRLTAETFVDALTGRSMTTEYEYNGHGMRTLTRNPLGHETHFTWHNVFHDRVVAQEDALGNVTRQEYDERGNETRTIDPLGNETKFACDEKGQLIAVTDPLGGVALNTYDDKGNLIKVKDALENETLHTYDNAGNRLTETDARGNTTAFEYDELNRLVGVTDASSNKVTHTYDANGNRTSTTDARGKITTYEYDGLDRLISETDAFSNKIIHAYDPNGNRGSTTDALGNITRYEYDSMNRLIGVIDAKGNKTVYTYDGQGNRLNIIDQAGGVTSYEYDLAGRRAAVMDAASNLTTYAYDANGNRIETIDPEGNITRYRYDALNRQTRLIDAQSNTVSYTYDARGRMISVADANGHVTTNEYDLLGRLTGVIDPSGATTRYTYDAAGNRTAIIDALGKTTAYAYDKVNRVTGITDAQSNTTTCTYDGNGNRATVTDPVGHTTRYEYDAANRLIVEIDPAGGRTTYAYDPNGNRIGVTDPLGRITRYEYDTLNRITAVIDPLGGRTVYAYDVRGNLVSKTDPNGNTIRHEYNALNQKTKGIFPDGVVYEWTYDARGNMLTKTVNGVLMQANTCDSLNRPLQRRLPAWNNRLSAYEYDAAGNRVKMIEPEGITFYEYDARNRLIKMRDPDGDEAVFSYDELGRRVSLRYPNGCLTAYAYDSNNRLLSLVTRGPGQSIISSYSYEYDKAGNRTSMREADGTRHAYQYDAKYQLTDWQRRGTRGKEEYHFQYAYDAAGNRTELKKQSFGRDNPKTDDWWDHPSHSYSYDAANRLIEIGPGSSAGKGNGKNKGAGNPWTVRFEYDANGNQISKTDQHGTATCEYDYQNLLKKITYPDGRENTFQNCRCGPVRRMKQDSAGTTKYLYDFDETYLLHECDENWTPNAHYMLGPGIDEILKKKYLSGASWRRAYYHSEGIGSVRTLTDENGNVIGRYEYEPFGKILSQPEGLDNNFTFQGREWDRDSELYYFRARYMDPRLGRFTSRDPLMDILIQNRAGYRDPGPGLFAPRSGCGNGCSWGFLSRDPIGDRAFFILYSQGRSRRDIEELYQRVHLPSYLFVQNNPIQWVDPLGLRHCSREQCHRKCDRQEISCLLACVACLLLPPPLDIECGLICIEACEWGAVTCHALCGLCDCP